MQILQSDFNIAPNIFKKSLKFKKTEYLSKIVSRKIKFLHKNSIENKLFRIFSKTLLFLSVFIRYFMISRNVHTLHTLSNTKTELPKVITFSA